jgi:DNA-binding transcriptional LysR family regulator
MNLQQLRYLVAAADTGSVSGAARTERVSQPVASRALHDLERQFGVRLLRRSGRRLTLTDPGLAVVAAARRALQAVEEVERTARRFAPGSELNVVTTPTNSVLLSPIVTAFIRNRPQAELRLRRAASMSEVLDMVAAGEADLGFGDLAHQHAHRSVHLEALWQAEIVLVSPIGTELPPAVRVRDLTASVLILPPEGSERRRHIDDVFTMAGVQSPPLAMATDERSAWIISAQRGVGSFLSYQTVAADLDGVEVRPFSPSKRTVVGFAYRTDSLSEGGREMLRLAEDLPVPAGCRPSKNRPPQPESRALTTARKYLPQ